ncbi:MULTISPECIES: alpha-galactosidase [unclassified Isoptericola]|uniref:alpha-galactosidase n=1 Tax=unclassified Isoptericola TaxID=2623355 RepID=UPI00365BA355
MTSQTEPPTTLPGSLHLHAAGCSVLLEIPATGLPVVRHWGAALGDLDGELARTIIDTATPGNRSSDIGADRPSLVPEPWTGWMGRPGLVGSRAGRSWSTKFRLDEIRVDGDRLEQGAHVDLGAGVVELDALDPEARLALLITIEMLPSGLVRTRARLRNDGAAYDLQRLSVVLPVPGQATELLDFGGRWGMERMPQRQDFGVGAHVRENRQGLPGCDAAYVLHAMEKGTDFERGECWGVHVAWSGNTDHVAEHTGTGVRQLGGGELLLPGEVRLAEGESYETPWLYASYAVGLDRVAHRFHDHLRARASHVDSRRPVTLNVWEAVYFDHQPERLIGLAELAAEVGVERFVLDDGWFGGRRNSRAGLGDWHVSSDVFPDGLHPLVDAVTSRGMQFGLWFEPEMVNLDSDLARAHPEWIMAARSELPVEQRTQHVLNLSIPECYDAVLAQVLAVLDEYDISYVKWDHNRSHVEGGVQPAGGVPAEHAQTLALYRMLAEIKAAHPDLEIESCAGGGGRIDLGILEHTDRVWVSDCNDPLERQRLHRWTGQLLPPELMGAHVASPRSHTTGRTHDLSFRAGTMLFGHFGIEWDVSSATPEERSELSRWVALYKEVRDVVCTGRVWRGPDPDESMWSHGVVSLDGSRGLFEVAALSWCAPDAPPLARLRGLGADRFYRVRALSVGEKPGYQPEPDWCSGDGVVLSGVALMSVGLQLPVLWPEHSTLVEVRAIDG